MGGLLASDARPAGWTTRRSLQPRKERRLKITFFAGSVVGYVDNPSAIYARGLAHGLALRGNDVRIVEERQNDAFARTLREAGSGAARHFHDNFRLFQHNTYEPRSGGRLLEWTTRELALIDIAVAVAGLEQELCRWLANLSHPGLVRAYLTFDPAALTDDVVTTLELEKYDLILAPSQPTARVPWQPIALAIADQDRIPAIAATIDPSIVNDADPIRAAEGLEATLTRARFASRV